MSTPAFVDTRREAWEELARLLDRLDAQRGGPSRAEALDLARLYRSACADLALARAHRLPDDISVWLEALVARASIVLYRGRRFRPRRWGERLFVEVPRRLATEPLLAVSAALFFGLFGLSWAAAAMRPELAVEFLGEETVERFVTMHASRDGGRETAESAGMAGFYLGHNAGIGLLAFAGGVLLGLGTLLVLISNAITIGLVFGYLVTTHARGPFLDFVTAHAPLELSAVVLCGAAGLRLGWSVVLAGERSRLVALREGGRQALPIAVTAVVLFFLAGCVEGFVSPADIPWSVKLAVATSTGLLLIHWIASGHPVFRTRRRRSRSGQEAP